MKLEFQRNGICFSCWKVVRKGLFYFYFCSNHVMWFVWSLSLFVEIKTSIKWFAGLTDLLKLVYLLEKSTTVPIIRQRRNQSDLCFSRFLLSTTRAVRKPTNLVVRLKVLKVRLKFNFNFNSKRLNISNSKAIILEN